jgi:hypothetical protein
MRWVVVKQEKKGELAMLREKSYEESKRVLNVVLLIITFI